MMSSMTPTLAAPISPVNVQKVESSSISPGGCIHALVIAWHQHSGGCAQNVRRGNGSRL